MVGERERRARRRRESPRRRRRRAAGPRRWREWSPRCAGMKLPSTQASSAVAVGGLVCHGRLSWQAHERRAIRARRRGLVLRGLDCPRNGVGRRAACDRRHPQNRRPRTAQAAALGQRVPRAVLGRADVAQGDRPRVALRGGPLPAARAGRARIGCSPRWASPWSEAGFSCRTAARPWASASKGRGSSLRSRRRCPAYAQLQRDTLSACGRAASARGQRHAPGGDAVALRRGGGGRARVRRASWRPGGAREVEDVIGMRGTVVGWCERLAGSAVAPASTTTTYTCGTSLATAATCASTTGATAWSPSRSRACWHSGGCRSPTPSGCACGTPISGHSASWRRMPSSSRRWSSRAGWARSRGR